MELVVVQGLPSWSFALAPGHRPLGLERADHIVRSEEVGGCRRRGAGRFPPALLPRSPAVLELPFLHYCALLHACEKIMDLYTLNFSARHRFY